MACCSREIEAHMTSQGILWPKRRTHATARGRSGAGVSVEVDSKGQSSSWAQSELGLDWQPPNDCTVSLSVALSVAWTACRLSSADNAIRTHCAHSIPIADCGVTVDEAQPGLAALCE